MGNAATETIAEIAGRQHGVIARWQLRQHGFERGLVSHRAARGDLLSLPGYRGVYAAGHQALTRSAILMAATLAHRAVLSHGSAAELWGLRGQARVIEATRPTKGHTTRRLVIHRSSTLGQDDREIRSSIPVTSVPRTLADISGRLLPQQLERVVAAAERQQLLDWSEMDAFLDRRHYGTKALREVLGRADPRMVEVYEGLEEIFFALWTAGPRPDPVAQALIEGFRVDFLWPLARVIVECDGYRYHSGRLKHDEDRMRDMKLRAAGYEVHRASHRILTEMPDQFIETVYRSIVTRSRQFRGG